MIPFEKAISEFHWKTWSSWHVWWLHGPRSSALSMKRGAICACRSSRERCLRASPRSSLANSNGLSMWLTCGVLKKPMYPISIFRLYISPKPMKKCMLIFDATKQIYSYLLVSEYFLVLISSAPSQFVPGPSWICHVLNWAVGSRWSIALQLQLLLALYMPQVGKDHMGFPTIIASNPNR
jgi:hypothetical protein